MSVRGLLYRLLGDDPELIALGLAPGALYANGAPDTPQQRFFCVLHWGPEVVGVPAQRGPGRVTDRELSAWFYDKEPDYTAINKAIRRWCVLLDALEAIRTGDTATDGWITQCEWSGDGDDSYDETYEAWYRTSTYRIIASGD